MVFLDFGGAVPGHVGGVVGGGPADVGVGGWRAGPVEFVGTIGVDDVVDGELHVQHDVAVRGDFGEERLAAVSDQPVGGRVAAVDALEVAFEFRESLLAVVEGRRQGAGHGVLVDGEDQTARVGVEAGVPVTVVEERELRLRAGVGPAGVVLPAEDAVVGELEVGFPAAEAPDDAAVGTVDLDDGPKRARGDLFITNTRVKNYVRHDPISTKTHQVVAVGILLY